MKREALIISDRPRCFWAKDPLLASYHDQEWGIASYDDTHLFEHLILEIFQAGLSWLTILRRRPEFRRAFAEFNAEKVASFGERDRTRLLGDSGIIRNRLKIDAAIHNAGAVLEVCETHGSFQKFIWQFAPKPRKQRLRLPSQVPATSRESEVMAKGLKKAGFKFVGPTGCYAFMQSVGMVDDHLQGCFCAVRADQKVKRGKK